MFNLISVDTEPLIPQPEVLRTNSPVPKNLHWSCWPEPIPKEKKRPSTSLGFYRDEKKGHAKIENRVSGLYMQYIGILLL